MRAFVAAVVVSPYLAAHVLALSSPSPLNGYHFGAATANRAGASPNKKVSSSDFLQKKPKAYVPDGLTEEQYRRIRNDELAEQRGMNFGSYGPRFRQIDGDPDSNWFNMPSLWTGGFNAGQNKRAVQNSGSGENGVENRMGIPGLIMTYMRRYGLAYMMLLLSTQLLSRSLAVKKVMSSKWVAARVVLAFAILKPLNVISSLLGQRQIGGFEKHGTTKLAGMVAMLLTLISFALR